MNLIYNNPYRILGLPITASEREIARQINSLAAYAEMGKTKTFDTDFPFLPRVERSPHAIEEAKKQIEQSESKLLCSLFWFWKNNTADELAFEVLQAGNTGKAISIWETAAFASKNAVYKPVVLIENLIAQSAQWPDQDDETHTLKKNTDEYTVNRKTEASYSVPSASVELGYEGNWSMEVYTSWLGGADNMGYGIIFGREKGSYHSFSISANGYYCFNKNIDWTFSSIIDWKPADAIARCSYNHILIKKIGSQLFFYINGTYADSAPSEPFYGKFFGFKVVGKQKISFRNFKFCKLTQDATYAEGVNVTGKNFSNVKNLSTLYLGLAMAGGAFQPESFKKGVALARSFFSSENIGDYSKLIAGERYVYSADKTLHFYVSEVVDSLKNLIDKPGGITTNQLISSFSTFPVEVKQFLNSRFAAKQIQNIDKEIEKAKGSRKNSPEDATGAGRSLVKNTKEDIAYLKGVLGEADYQYATIADKLSQAVMQCGIDAFNLCKTEKGEIDYPKAIKSEEGYMSEYEYSLGIAATERAKGKATENLDTCNQYIKNKQLYNCWFCGKNPPEAASKFEITIYKVTSRSYRKVNFSYVPVTVPRCPDCLKIHKKGGDKYLVGCLFLPVAVIIGALIDGHWGIGLIVGIVVSSIVGAVLQSRYMSRSGIKGTDDSDVKDYPALKEMLKDGWQLHKPSA